MHAAAFGACSSFHCFHSPLWFVRHTRGKACVGLPFTARSTIALHISALSGHVGPTRLVPSIYMRRTFRSRQSDREMDQQPPVGTWYDQQTQPKLSTCRPPNHISTGTTGTASMAHGHAHHHVPEEPERAAQHAQPASEEEEVSWMARGSVWGRSLTMSRVGWSGE